MSKPKSDILLDRMMSLHPKLIDLTLDRMWRILAALEHPERRLSPVIHIAGTNGKGSTLAMIRAGLEGGGHAVHAYTSPHLVRFHERIRLDGKLIEEDALARILDRCLGANGPDPITYFEITTAAAFVAFAEQPSDYTLLEVGLGGRLDATNVIERPAVTVITPVDMDHQQFLGDTRAKIAGEKAGIIKRGVPVIVGRQEDDALDVIERQAARMEAPVHAMGQHWHVAEERGRLVFQDETGLLDLPLPALRGRHQVENAGMALAALRLLGQPEEVCEAAMRDVSWPARMQRLRRGPLVDAAPRAELWLDGGHNPHAAHALCDLLDSLPDRPTHMVCGMLNTKDVAGYLSPFSKRVERLWAVGIDGQAATLSAAETADAARRAGMAATEAGSCADAVAAIVEETPDARILIAGSLYLAGLVLSENG